MIFTQSIARFRVKILHTNIFVNMISTILCSPIVSRVALVQVRLKMIMPRHVPAMNAEALEFFNTSILPRDNRIRVNHTD